MTLLTILTAIGTGRYVVTFANYTPSPRYDTIPWTQVKVEEAPAKIGPWTELVTGALSPIDADPKNPAPRDVTVNGATLAAGWYRLTFLDAAGNMQPTRPVYSGASISPGLDDIARAMRSRLADAGGQAITAFSATTRPTRDDVEGFIRSGVRAVRLRVGAVQDTLAEDAREVVELYATARAELATWPEQTANTASPYSALMDEFKAALLDLEKSSQEVGEGREPGAAGDVGMPVSSFPLPSVDYTAGW